MKKNKRGKSITINNVLTPISKLTPTQPCVNNIDQYNPENSSNQNIQTLPSKNEKDLNDRGIKIAIQAYLYGLEHVRYRLELGMVTSEIIRKKVNKDH